MVSLKLSFSTLFVFLIILLLFSINGGFAQGSLPGTWKTIEISFSSPDTSGINMNPLPGLFIFGKKHYSIMHATGATPRVLFADYSNGTDAEMLAAYKSFWANSGTYEISGTTITTRTMVAKHPNRMAEGRMEEFQYKLDGNMLWLTFSWNTDNGKIVNVFKCSRLE